MYACVVRQWSRDTPQWWWWWCGIFKNSNPSPLSSTRNNGHYAMVTTQWAVWPTNTDRFGRRIIITHARRPQFVFRRCFLHQKPKPSSPTSKSRCRMEPPTAAAHRGHISASRRTSSCWRWSIQRDSVAIGRCIAEWRQPSSWRRVAEKAAWPRRRAERGGPNSRSSGRRARRRWTPLRHRASRRGFSFPVSAAAADRCCNSKQTTTSSIYESCGWFSSDYTNIELRNRPTATYIFMRCINFAQFCFSFYFVCVPWSCSLLTLYLVNLVRFTLHTAYNTKSTVFWARQYFPSIYFPYTSGCERYRCQNLGLPEITEDLRFKQYIDDKVSSPYQVERLTYWLIVPMAIAACIPAEITSISQPPLQTILLEQFHS